MRNRKYSFNENYFSSPNLENSYWAGFIAADGYVRETHKKGLRIKLGHKDKGHLEKFNKCIEYNKPLYIETRINPRNKNFTLEAVVFEVSSVALMNDLVSVFGIRQAKSLTHSPPENLKLTQELAYIKGYIDGDGSIFYSNVKKINKSYLHLAIVGTKPFLLWCQEKFNKIEHGIKSSIRPTGKMFILELSGKNALKILNILSKFDTPHLERKWRIVNDYINVL